MNLTPAIRACILADSDRRDRELDAQHAAWRGGYHAGQASRDSEYQAGFADGVLAAKQAQHGIVRGLCLELRRWDGLRQHFSQPRPGDYTGGPVTW